METTQVRALVRALDDGTALVEVQGGGCGRCHESGGCGGHHLTQVFCGAPRTYCASNPFGAQVGDEVMVGIPARAVFVGATLAYTLPVLALLLGALTGMAFGGDMGAMLGGGLGLVLAWFFVRYKARSGAGNPDFRPQILAPGSTQNH
ncbi:MAG: SoxR reducing system protein RseC [Betaproteobacteria bacterium ADurb.Bin341]|nr:MAG: SoxR reducing system protein RseC [Betaproteobacteria bacterium ADurb.Bin341]